MTDSVHYLDYAATSAVRPPQVAEAVTSFLREIGATPGRGGHRLSLEAGRMAFRARKLVARTLGLAGSPERTAFTLNATQGLNAALWGLLRRGDVVVTTAYDHNSVLRPVHLLEKERGVVSRRISGRPTGDVDFGEVEEKLEGARLLVVNAVSNVLGTRLPLREMAERAHAVGALVLVDAAQWGGHFVESLSDLGADLVAFTGHKGLLGPQGIGGLWVREGLDLSPWWAGGTGGDSQEREMPASFPQRLEAGSGNAPGMAGLSAGMEFLEDRGIENLHREEMELKERLWNGLDGLRGVRVLSPLDLSGVGIVTIICHHVHPGELAQRLDQEWGVMVRYGLNCAPEVHNLLGTGGTGAVRFSLGWNSSEDDVRSAVEGVDAITSPPVVPVS